MDLPAFELGYPRTALRQKLVDAALRGDKTATAGLYEQNEPLPRVGDRSVLLGFDDEPVAVVETTAVRVVRTGDVDLAFAKDEAKDSRASPTGGASTRASGQTGRSTTTH